MFKTRMIAIMMISIMLIGLLSGCAQKSSTTDSSSKESDKQIKLKFTYWGSPNEKTAVESSLKKFEEKYKDIKVEAMYIPNADYPTKMAAMVAGNDAPDVAYLSEATALNWAEADKLYNINDFLSKDADLKKESFLDNIWYNWAPDKTLGTNTACEAIGLFYNADMMKEAGVETPPSKGDNAWTWDKFVEVAKKLTVDENGKNATQPEFNPNKIKQYGVQFSPNWVTYMPMVYSNGGDYINQDGTKFTLTSPEATEAIQKMADLINVYHVAPSPAEAKSMPSPVVSMQAKQVAMLIDGQWNLLDLGKAGFNFGVGVLPKLKKSVTMVLGSPTVIFKSTKHPEESWLLYKWLANPESSLDLHAGGLWMPLLKDWYTKPELLSKWAKGNPAHPDSYVDAIVDQTEKNGISGPTYYTKGFAEIDAVVTPALDQVWVGKMSAADALKSIETQAQAALKGRYKNTK